MVKLEFNLKLLDVFKDNLVEHEFIIWNDF